MATISILHTVVTLNGHIVSGWSDDADALMMPDSFNISTVRRGAAGDMAVFSTGDRGGPVEIKLLPNSPSMAYFMQQATLLLAHASIVWSGTIRNTQAQFGFSLERGAMTAFPLGQTMGKGEVANQSFVFEFETILPDYDAFVIPVPEVGTI